MFIVVDVEIFGCFVCIVVFGVGVGVFGIGVGVGVGVWKFCLFFFFWKNLFWGLVYWIYYNIYLIKKSYLLICNLLENVMVDFMNIF